MAFDQVATRKNAYLRLALSGTAGAGKTYSALLFAKEFGGKKIGLMDSERGSSQKYAGRPGLPVFYPENLEEKNVQEYLAKIQEAADAKVDVLIIDSYSHSWLGALETVDKMGGSKFSNGWKVVSPMVTKLVDAILSYPGHVIATMRSKSDYAIENVNGKAIPKKIGMATVAREGTDFEFDVMLDLSGDGVVTVAKTRCPELNANVFTREDVPKIAKILKAWLDEGSPISPIDAMAEQIRFAQTEQALLALVPELQKLPDADRQQLKAVYAKRRRELAEAT